MKNIAIMGPPGSGKDTQIDELEKVDTYEIISAGNIARKLAEKDKKIQEIVYEGGLINDEVILNGVDSELGKIGSNKSVLFDGFPRTLHQAQKLDEILSHHNRFLDAVVYIALEEDEIVKRLSVRRVCSLCGKNIPKGAEKCVHCPGRPIQRHDDQPAVIINRVQTFLEKSLPLFDYYIAKGKLIEVNGNQTVTAIADDIKEKLGNVEAR